MSFTIPLNSYRFVRLFYAFSHEKTPAVQSFVKVEGVKYISILVQKLTIIAEKNASIEVWHQAVKYFENDKFKREK